ncbi:S8 family serine peptidase [Dokdonella soli]|uniref:S8 family serine peptidase n=1 Tax=Dokdonella soli TaxID=529810 RepID=UPI0031E332D8
MFKVRAGLDNNSLANIEGETDANMDDEVSHVDSGVVRRIRSRSMSVDQLLSALRGDPNVIYAEPNYIVHANTVPNDPRFSELWGMRNIGQTILGVPGTVGADIKAEPAWTVTTGTRSIVVGIVDTGIDYAHIDLSGNVWNNPGGIGGCGVGTHGFNAITKTCDPNDDHYHGTHCAGTIGALGNNNTGVVGVNWATSIMGLKFLDASGSGTTADAISAIDFAVNAKIAGVNVRVLSNSWGGGGFSQALLDEINKANANDILFVAAAGNAATNNDVTPHYPSSYNAPNVVSIAATDNNDGLASFSNYGATSVHLGAPGVDILSTQPGNLYQYLSGTSMATPHVAGAAALILSKSTLTTAQLKSTLLSSVDSIPSLAGKTSTGGRLNVCKGIPGCGGPPPPPTPDFTLSISPPSVTLPAAGGTATYAVAIARTGGFTAAVAFSVSSLPAGATGSFNPASTTGNSSTLTVTVAASTVAGTYPLTITGTGGSPTLTRTAAATLVKQGSTPPPCTDGNCQN